MVTDMSTTTNGQECKSLVNVICFGAAAIVFVPMALALGHTAGGLLSYALIAIFTGGAISAGFKRRALKR